MSEDPTYPTQTPMLFAEDSLASHSVTRGGSKLKTTPVTSGQRCLGLSGNAGPLGLLEKTLLESSTWAWTKYSLTWKAKATPQGRLIFQLARLAPRTLGSGSGLLHTPTAKANQMAPSMATRGSGNWVSDLWPTPTASDHKGSGPTVVRKDGKIRNDRLDYAVEQFWPTPRAEKVTDENEESWRKRNLKGDVSTPPLSLAVKMWPTPNARENGGGEYQDPEKIKARMEKGYQANLGDVVKLWPTPTGMTGGEGVAPSHLDGTHGWNTAAAVHHMSDQKSGGQLSPLWVAWLMGYPTGYLNSVPWETPSSRKSRKKSEKQ